MKAIYFIMIFAFSLLFSGCNTYKETQERKNLMMPKKSEMPRNAERYQEMKKRKTYKTNKKKKKKNKHFF